MNPETRRVLSEVLEDRYFSKAVDLGCGEGYYSDIMKRHVGYLIGVDHNLGRLSVAREFGGYDKVVYADMREYEIPADTEAVFMLDSLEHIPKDDGYKLLSKLKNVFIVITTPSRMGRWGIAGIRNHHQSLWTEQELQQLGFKTRTYRVFFFSLFYGPEILAVREPLY